MEQNGYTEESYEAWRDNASEGAGIPDMELPGMDELVEKKLLLGVLADAMDSLLPEERELAMKVSEEETVTLKEYKALQKEIQCLKIENEILKKATAIFAKEQ